MSEVLSKGVIAAILIGVAAGVGACSNPAAPDVLIEPIQIDRVDVRILESSPPMAVAHVEGFVGDGCSSLHLVEPARSGNTVTVTILRRRLDADACIQIAILYDEDIPLPGQYPPGTYVLRVNGVERTFTTQ
jgi:hypothetical protein